MYNLLIACMVIPLVCLSSTYKLGEVILDLYPLSMCAKLKLLQKVAAVSNTYKLYLNLNVYSDKRFVN